MSAQIESTKIDFHDIAGPVYTGRSRGEQLRENLHLDAVDASGGNVIVEIPEGTYTISSSFFLGLFGPSVVSAGSKDLFYSRYLFKSPAFLKEVIDGYVSRALQTRNLFI
jgi:hypothetical protein